MLKNSSVKINQDIIKIHRVILDPTYSNKHFIRTNTMKPNDFISFDLEKEVLICGKSGDNPLKVKDYILEQSRDWGMYLHDWTTNHPLLNAFDFDKMYDETWDYTNELAEVIIDKFCKSDLFVHLSNPEKLEDIFNNWIEDNAPIIAAKWLIKTLKDEYLI
jgi:hypothetical protein